MTVALRLLRPDEIDGYLAQGVEAYARQMIDHGGFSKERAYEKSRADTAWLASSGAAFFGVESDGELVGYLVLGERERDGDQVAFVYDVTIAAERRGAGIGRKAMQLAEDEARARGHARVDLNVFGGNEIARSLYRALGYRETAVTMRKDLP